MHDLISDMIRKLDYNKTLKIVIDSLRKPLTLIKYKHFISISWRAKKIKDAKSVLVSLLLSKT